MTDERKGDTVSMVDTDAQKIAALKREVEQYKEAYELWKADGQALHAALLTVWRAVTPDSEHGVFQSPQQAEDDILQVLTEPSSLSVAVLDIAQERATHSDRGWTPEHDAEHGYGHLISLTHDRLATAFNLGDNGDMAAARKQLVKAAALIVAGIDLIDAHDEDDQ